MKRLSSAATSGVQADTARALAREHRAARRTIAAIATAPAVEDAQRALTTALVAIERSYSRLALAARRHRAGAYAGAERSVRRSEAELSALLRRL